MTEPSLENRRPIKSRGSGALPIGCCTDGVLLVSGLTPPLNLKSWNI